MSVEETFSAAVDVIENLPTDGTFQPSEDLMLKLYAYYMQATEGPCKTSRPSIWYYSSRVKWNAWNELGNMGREVAMEKYVEELTKVIETMSYNENVSKFMSLLGPFYEIVSSEEFDMLPEIKSSKKTPAEYSYPIKKEDLQTAEVEYSSKKVKDDFDFCCTIDPVLTSPNLRVNSATYIPRQSVIDMIKAKTNLKHRPFSSRQDILILTIINLQNSLQEIVQKLENLQCLANSADFSLKVVEETQTHPGWNLGYSGTALALLWPIAVHLCSKSF